MRREQRIGDKSLKEDKGKQSRWRHLSKTSSFVSLFFVILFSSKHFQREKQTFKLPNQRSLCRDKHRTKMIRFFFILLLSLLCFVFVCFLFWQKWSKNQEQQQKRGETKCLLDLSGGKYFFFNTKKSRFWKCLKIQKL